MKEKENIYKTVPGQGQKLADGTWWTNSRASVGELCEVEYYYRKISNGKYWASNKRSECVETAMFGGKPFESFGLHTFSPVYSLHEQFT